MFNAAHAGQVITFGETWTAVLAFSFQIYFDFSAYSDMAIGLARMFGITLPVNFNSPYKATSIIEFWRRWHMTLSRFLRDYLYFPLGGSRRGVPVHILSVMTVMLLGGLWHGAAWSFMLWGGIHGALILVNHAYRRANAFIPPSINPLRLAAVCWGLTFMATTFAWVPFRAADLETALLIWRTLLGLENLYLPYVIAPIFGETGLWTIESAVFDNAIYHGVLQSLGMHGGLPILPIAALICFCLPNSQQWLEWEAKKQPASRAAIIDRLKTTVFWRPNIAWATILCCAGFYALAQNKNPQTFVYFQF